MLVELVAQTVFLRHLAILKYEVGLIISQWSVLKYFGLFSFPCTIKTLRLTLNPLHTLRLSLNPLYWAISCSFISVLLWRLSALYSPLQHTETFRPKHRQKMGGGGLLQLGHGLM